MSKYRPKQVYGKQTVSDLHAISFELRHVSRSTAAIMASSSAGVSTARKRPVFINPLQTKRRPLYLKPQFIPRCKHFSSRL